MQKKTFVNWLRVSWWTFNVSDWHFKNGPTITLFRSLNQNRHIILNSTSNCQKIYSHFQKRRFTCGCKSNEESIAYTWLSNHWFPFKRTLEISAQILPRIRPNKWLWPSVSEVSWHVYAYSSNFKIINSLQYLHLIFTFAD